MKQLTMLSSFDALPPKFAPQKPMRELPKLVPARGHFIIQRKRDGQRHYVLVTDRDEIRIYSSTVRDMTNNFPLIVRELSDLGLPKRTVIDGEIICDEHGIDNFRATNECCRAHPPKSKMAERRLPIRYMAFDILWWTGQAVWELPYAERWQLLKDEAVTEDGNRVIVPETFDRLDLAQRKVKSRRWEGLVLWDPTQPAMIRADGVFPRHGSYKWKPTEERDFIAIGWNEGTGKHKGRMGALVLAEWSNGLGSANRQGRVTPGWVTIGQVGTGFTDAERERAIKWKYPRVVTVQFMFQQPDTRALREPRFIRCENGKKVSDLQ